MENLIISHGLLAYVSLALLLTRGVFSAKNVDWRAYKILKIAPHLIDTLLLGTGIAIVAMLLGNSYVEIKELLWLVPKLMFIALYIIFSVKAFKKSQPFSLKHFLLAVVSFMLAMVVAVTR